MKLTTFVTRIGNAIETLYAAGAAASAIEGGRQPRARDLDRLGIDRKAFARIGR